MTEIPVSLVAPVKLSTDTPNGVFLPFSPAGVLMLAIAWEAKPHIVYLNGEKPFACFAIQAGYSARGSIISDVEFVVDLTSQYDATRDADPLGALVIQDGRASIMAFRPGGFDDAFEVPLWLSLNSWSPEEKVGFARWSIVVRDGDDRVTLWQTPTS